VSTPGGGTDGGAAGGDPLASLIASVGGVEGRLPVLAWATTTMFGVLVFAWVLRRPQREEESPLAAALSFVANARTGRRVEPSRAVAPPATTVGPVLLPDDDLMPVEPIAVAPAANRPTGGRLRPALRFQNVAGLGVVRRQITYRLIRLSDAPDDLRSNEIMRLDRGDEVEILGQEGSYIQVRTPTGEVGWVRSDSVYS